MYLIQQIEFLFQHVKLSILHGGAPRLPVSTLQIANFATKVYSWNSDYNSMSKILNS